MVRRIVSLIAVLLITGSAGAQVPDDAAIRKILADRVDTQHRAVGIVVGVITPEGRRIVGHGTLNRTNSAAVGGDTVFEIGSISKVFTSLLLADMVERGEVALSDPIAKFLPSTVKVPKRGGKEITLVDLATHTSGLPRLPSNMLPANPANPYADYSVEQLYEFLSSYELTRDIGTQYEYSNLGAGLLGHILSLKARTDFETLLQRRVAGPLGMKSTSIRLSDDQQKRLATGHDEELTAVGNWDLPTLAGAGAIRSTANDMLTLLAAELGLVESPLKKAMARTLAERRPLAQGGQQIALAWHIAKAADREIIWHNGGTGGYRSFAGFDPKRRVGVVVLSNTFTASGVDDIGMHLLEPSVPMAGAPKQRKEMKLDAKVLSRYAGRYELAPNFVLTVTEEGGRLFSQATGQPKVEVFAESEREFFLKVVDAQISFEADGDKPAPALVLHQNGRDMRAKRIGDAPAAKPAPVEVKVSGEALQRLVGRYQLAPAFALDVTRDGERLFVQATAQPKFEVFAKSATEFFYKVVDAQLTFELGPDGRAKSVTLHQNGMDLPGRRVE